MTSTPEASGDQPLDAVDESLLATHDLARSALLEITPASTVGAPAGYTIESGEVVSLRFENLMPGYPGWFWTVSVAKVADAEPTVLEVELLPGESALLAPDWVPWALRLADYQAAQVALAEAGVEVDDHDDADLDDEDEDDDELDDLDAADFDNDGSPILHSGDLDGVDIDELDEDAHHDEAQDEYESDDDDESHDDDESDDDESDESDDAEHEDISDED